ncbi:MAG: hypothetical protein ACRDPR_14745, partial [Nocardioidaceae bacterium]
GLHLATTVALATRPGHSLHGATILRLPSARGIPGQPFGEDIVEQLNRDGLLGQVLWGTSCVAADVTAGTFRWLYDTGLVMVRLDLDGSAADLRGLVTALQTLRRLGILVEYDLDLFGRSPRFASVRSGLAVLSAISGDGTTPARFRPGSPVDDCSPWLARFQHHLAIAVEPWLAEDGLSSRLATAWAELVVAERLLLGLTGVAAHRIAMQRLTLRSNMDLLSLVTRSAADFELTGDTSLLNVAQIAARCAVLDRAITDLQVSFLTTNAASLSAGRVRR